MISWILSALFPAWEPSYQLYRRKTKNIPVMSGSQARAYLMHLAPKHTTILWTWEDSEYPVPVTYQQKIANPQSDPEAAV